jgi:hypothetical protein
MSTVHATQTVIEILLVTAVIIGIFNESKLANFEQKIINKIKRSK